jgi:S-formylglutathione hydrolase FrmB
MFRVFSLLILVICVTAADAAAQARTVRLASATYGGAERIFSVLLPVGYAESEKRYPVLYLLHGGGQDHSAFMARSGFARTARRNEMIVVMPAADRTIAGRADAQTRYETFLATELVPYVDGAYRTLATQQGRAIGGISQGGGFAASTALRYPHIFGAVGALSPAFRGAGAASDSAPATPPHFYVSCGTADSLLSLSQQLVEVLKARGIPHDYRELPGGDHSWAVWDAQLVVFVDLLAQRGWRE